MRCGGPARSRCPRSACASGLQCMVIEYARDVAGIDGASSTEFEPRHPGAGHRDEWRSRRPSSRARATSADDAPRRYPADLPRQRRRQGLRHRARPRAAPPPLRGQQRLPGQLEEAGLVFSGLSPDHELVEFVELPADVHPYYVSTQAHTGVPLPPRPRAPALRRARRGRSGPPARRAARRGPALARGRAGRRARGRLSRAWTSPSGPAPTCATRSSTARWCAARRRTRGLVWDVTRDRVDLGDRREVTREYVDHPGAVIVVALRESTASTTSR